MEIMDIAYDVSILNSVKNNLETMKDILKQNMVETLIKLINMIEKLIHIRMKKMKLLNKDKINLE